MKAFRLSHGIPEDGFAEWSDIEGWLEGWDAYEGEPYEPGKVPVEACEEPNLQDFHLLANSIVEEVDALAHRLMERYGKRHPLRSDRWLRSLRYYLVLGKLYPPVRQKRAQTAQEGEIQARNRKIMRLCKKYGVKRATAIYNSGLTQKRANGVIKGLGVGASDKEIEGQLVDAGDKEKCLPGEWLEEIDVRRIVSRHGRQHGTKGSPD